MPDIFDELAAQAKKPKPAAAPPAEEQQAAGGDIFDQLKEQGERAIGEAGRVPTIVGSQDENANNSLHFDLGAQPRTVAEGLTADARERRAGPKLTIRQKLPLPVAGTVPFENVQPEADQVNLAQPGMPKLPGMLRSTPPALPSVEQRGAEAAVAERQPVDRFDDSQAILPHAVTAGVSPGLAAEQDALNPTLKPGEQQNPIASGLGRATEAVNGLVQMFGPAIAVDMGGAFAKSPFGMIKGFALGIGASHAAEKAARAAGLPEQAVNFIKTIAFYAGPAAADVAIQRAGEAIGARAIAGENAAGVTVGGDEPVAGVGVARTPEAYEAKVKVGSKEATVRIPRAAQAPQVEAPTIEGEAPAPDVTPVTPVTPAGELPAEGVAMQPQPAAAPPPPFLKRAKQAPRLPQEAPVAVAPPESPAVAPLVQNPTSEAPAGTNLYQPAADSMGFAAAKRLAAGVKMPEGFALTPPAAEGGKWQVTGPDGREVATGDDYSQAYHAFNDARKAAAQPPDNKQIAADLDAKEKKDAAGMTPQALDKSLTRALHGFSGAESRWAALKKNGATDEELKRQIADEFGIQGGATGDESHAGFNVKGGTEPAYWYGVYNREKKPTLRGKALVDHVRDLLDIPPPQELADDTSATEQFAQEQQDEALAKRTPERENAALKDALHPSEGAAARWEKRRQEGLSDEQLREAIAYEFHARIMASGGESHGGFNVRGGADPKFWYGASGQSLSPKDNLTGKGLIRRVRELLDIPEPAAAPKDIFDDLAAQPAAAAPAKEGTPPKSAWMNRIEVEQAAEKYKDHPVLGKATKFLKEFVEEVDDHSDGWSTWPLPAHAMQSLMNMIQHPEYASEANLAKALGPVKAFMTKRGTAAGMKMPPIETAAKPAKRAIPKNLTPGKEPAAPPAPERTEWGGFKKGEAVTFEGKRGTIVSGESIRMMNAMPLGGRMVAGPFGGSEATHIVTVKMEDGKEQIVGTQRLKHVEEPTEEKKPAETKYKFNSTQVNLPETAAQSIRDAAKGIKPADLAGDGLADHPHVTVRYGIHGDDQLEKVKAEIEQHAPFTARFGKIGVFPPSEHSDGAAVLHAEVIAPELAKLNARIGEVASVEPPSFKEYKPHATVAYVKPEAAAKYKSSLALESAPPFEVKSIAFTDRNGQQTEIALKGKSTEAAEEHPALAHGLPKGVTVYASGSNRIPEIRGFAQAGVPVGVDVSEIAPDAIAELKKFAGKDIPVFVDSGAFGEVAVRDGKLEVAKPITDAEWKRRLAIYKDLAEALGGQLSVVAPDRVGDQDETFQRIQRYAPELYALGKLGAHVLVPVQQGEMTPAAFFEKIQSELAPLRVTPALPMKKAAASPQDAINFAMEVQPSNLHLLGMGATTKAGKQLIRMLKNLDPTLELSLDSNRLRAVAGEGRPFTERNRELKAQEPEGAFGETDLRPFGEQHDYTDAISTPSAWATKAQLEGAAKAANLTPSERKSFIEKPDEFLQQPYGQGSRYDDEALAHALDQAWFEHIKNRNRAAVRGQVIKETFADSEIGGQHAPPSKPVASRISERTLEANNASAQPSRSDVQGEAAANAEPGRAGVAAPAGRPAVPEPAGESGVPSTALSPAGDRGTGKGGKAQVRARAADSAVLGDAGANASEGRQPARSPGSSVSGHPVASGEPKPQRSGIVKAGADGAPVKAATPEPADLVQAEEKRTRNARNFRISEDIQATIGAGGVKTKIRANLEAIKLLKSIQAEPRLPTPEEQAVLARYVDFGGLREMFDREWEHYQENQQLKDLVTAEELRQIKEASINAHYTALPVVDRMWELAQHLGFKGGRVLEPGMGVGNFFGRIPEALAKRSSLIGVERNTISAGIAQLLYPDAKVLAKSYESVIIPNDSQDLIIGNPPFAEIKIFDPAYTRPKLALHNYFIVKSLDKLKPGGVGVLITSHYTLDAQTVDARAEMLKRAELVGAIRLPGDAFKKNAGTMVTTDILVFRKRLPGELDNEKLAESEADFLNTVDMKIGAKGETSPVNEYYKRHPENILGKQALSGTMYRGGEYQVESDGRDLAHDLGEAIRQMPADVVKKITSVGGYQNNPNADFTNPDALAPLDVKPNAFYLDGDRLLVKQKDGSAQPVVAKPEVVAQIKSAVGVRDALKEVLREQMSSGEDTASLKAAQATLTKQYDAYRKKYGALTAPATTRAFSDDPEYPLLTALENVDPATKEVSKADIFSKRTARPYEPLRDLPADPKTAMLKVLAERGTLDVPLMAKLMTVPESEISQKLLDGELVFRDPVSGGFVTADEYLSGNVRVKLKQAKAVAELDDEYSPNVKALEKVQPEPLTLETIDLRLGQTWMPTQVYAEFITHLAGYGAPRWEKPRISRDSSGRWYIEARAHESSHDMMHKWGTPHRSGVDLVIEGLNLQQPTVYLPPDTDGHRALDPVGTALARNKLEEIKGEFERWLRSQDAKHHRKKLEGKYNDTFNGIKKREYDGSHLEFPGLNPVFVPRTYQANAVWRLLQEGRGLIDHAVGTGKTLTAMIAGMEMRRTGVSRKNIYVVPNNMIPQWREDFKKAYPASNVLHYTDADKGAKGRNRLMSRIATNDWDAVLIPHSQWNMLPISPERETITIRRQLKDLEEALSEMGGDSRQSQAAMSKGDKKTLRQMELAKQKFEQRLKELTSGRKDNTIYFDDLGADMVFIDEAHAYKALPTPTKMGNVKGLSRRQSQRAQNVLAKIEYLLESHKGRGIAFMTGTAITNTMAEAYIMNKYLAPDLLEKAGIRNFDDWAANFATTRTSMEYSGDGVTIKPSTSLTRFVNVPELQAMWSQFADTITKEDAIRSGTYSVPKIERKDVLVKVTEQQEPLLQEIADRGEELATGKVDPKVDNWLKLDSDARDISLDVRLYDDGLDGDPANKLTAAADEAYKILEEAKKHRGTVLIAADRYRNGSFNIFEEVKKLLVAKGIPAAEIRQVAEFPKRDQFQAMQADVNAGRIRVLMGSTEKMGIGLNVQRRMKGFIHLDLPQRPDQVEQRDGRIIRPGNLFEELGEPVYVRRLISEPRSISSPKAHDLQRAQLLERKQTFLTQFRQTGLNVRQMDDAAGEVRLSPEMFALAKAQATGNPLALERMKLEHEVKQLNLLNRGHELEHARIQYQLDRAQMAAAALESIIPRQQEVLDKFTENVVRDKEGKITALKVRVDGHDFTTPADLNEYIKANPAVSNATALALNGVEVPLQVNVRHKNLNGKQTAITDVEYKLAGEWHDAPRNDAAETTLQNVVTSAMMRARGMDASIEDNRNRLARYQEQIPQLQKDLGTKSPYEEKIREYEHRLTAIDTEMMKGVAQASDLVDADAATPDTGPEDTFGGEEEGDEEGLSENQGKEGKGLKSPRRQAGFATPAALIETPYLAVKGLRDILATEYDKVRQSRELHEDLYDLDGAQQADILRAVGWLKTLPGTLKDWESIYHHQENKGEPLTTEQLGYYHDLIEPILEESAEIYKKLNEGGLPLADYVHRVPIGKGGLIDRVMRALGANKERAGGRNPLNTKASALKGRTMMALEDAAGKRTVVSIKHGRVTAFAKNAAGEVGHEDRGPLRQGLKTEATVLQERTAPIEKAIRQLEHDRRVLNATPHSKAANAIRSRNIEKKLAKLKQQAADILDSVPESQLRDRVWTDKQGVKFKFTQATTKEIEANTSVEYYHHAAASALSSYLELRRAERAYDFLEQYKGSPEFAQVAVTTGEPGGIPKGWRPVPALQQFKGYAFEPHTAEVLEWLADRLKPYQSPGLYDKFAELMKTAIFFNPLIHLPNIINHWTVERGLLPHSPARTARAAVRAIDAVMHQNDDFKKALEAGAPLQSHNEALRDLNKLIFERMTRDLKQNPEIADKVAHALGYARPDNLIRAIYRFSSKVTWVSNDIAFMQSVYEKTDKGMDLHEAIRETGKHIPNYRLPTRVFDSPGMAKLLNNKGAVMFMPYHYGALKSYGEMMKDAFGPSSDAKGRARAWGMLAWLGLVTFVAYPAVDWLLKKLTHDKDAEMRRSGASTFVYNVAELVKGEMTPEQVIESTITPSVAAKMALELAINRETYSGRHVYDPHAHTRTIAWQLSRYGLNKLAPAQTADKVFGHAGSDSGKRAGLGLLGVRFKKHGAEAQAIASGYHDDKAPTPASEHARTTRQDVRRAAEHGDLKPAQQALAHREISTKFFREMVAVKGGRGLYESAKGLSYDDFMKVYNAATPEERKQLAPLLPRKQRLATRHGEALQAPTPAAKGSVLPLYLRRLQGASSASE